MAGGGGGGGRVGVAEKNGRGTYRVYVKTGNRFSRPFAIASVGETIVSEKRKNRNSLAAFL